MLKRTDFRGDWSERVWEFVEKWLSVFKVAFSWVILITLMNTVATLKDVPLADLTFGQVAFPICLIAILRGLTEEKKK